MPPRLTPDPPHIRPGRRGVDAGRGVGRGRLRPRGIALLMALTVVMLLTFFMSEYFFATGLELRGMTTYKNAQQARMLSRAVFKAVQVGLLQDEVEFFKAYDELHTLLEVASVPWNEGLLINLDIEPQDHLYNLNQNYNQQAGQDTDVARNSLFMNTMADVEVPDPLAGTEPVPIDPTVLAGLYAALFDWVDSDEEDYLAIPGVVGAEERAYFDTDPEVRIKNGMLDRLEEIRLVEGVRESGIPWGVWRQRFTALPREADSRYYFPEQINVNRATQPEIQRFLEDRRVNAALTQSNFQQIQDEVNVYADSAAEIASALVPEGDGEREVYDEEQLEEVLAQLGLKASYGVDYLFSTVDETYRIRIVTEVAGVSARLEAMLRVPRNEATRTGSDPEIEWVTFN